MLKRRSFLKGVGAVTAAALVSRHPLAAEIAGERDDALRFISESMELQLSAFAPEFLSLNVDGLGKGKRGSNIVDTKGIGGGYKSASMHLAE